MNNSRFCTSLNTRAMWLNYAYFGLLLTTTAIMLAQLFFKPVRVEHILTAIFCGSLSMVALQVLTADSGSAYHYIFALGTCGTCNLIWLISRALFRQKQPLSVQHYVMAGTIAVLVFTNYSLDLMVFVDWLSIDQAAWIKGAISEVTQLLSSTILALAFWESVRGFSAASKSVQQQRLLFAASFFSGVVSCTVVAEGMLSNANNLLVKPWLVVGSAMLIALSTFTILVWQHKERQRDNNPAFVEPEYQASPAVFNSDKALYKQIKHLMEQQHYFLQQDIKTIDIAHALNVSEYKVSRVIRTMTNSANVNQFINHYRIAHAKHLLTSEHSQHWTILVISLESGFASLAPFNRAFKAIEGCTPNQYRQQYQRNDSALQHPLVTNNSRPPH